MAGVEPASMGGPQARPEPSTTATAFSEPPPSAIPREVTQYPFDRPGVSMEDVNTSVPGWPALTRVIARNPELEAFPSFSDLAIKSLLYYQAELVYLRKQLHQVEYRDYFHGNRPESDFAENLEWLFAVCESGTEPEQWIIMEKIRRVLEKYNLALLQHSKISNLTKADDGNVKDLKNIARQIASSGSCIIGSGSATWGGLVTSGVKCKSFSSLLWDFFTSIFFSPNLEREPVPEEFQEKLIVPREGFIPPDSLTLWVLHNFIPLYGHIWRWAGSPTFRRVLRRMGFFKHPRTRDSETSIRDRAGNLKKTNYFSGSWILRMTFIAITVVACLLPTVAIVILAQVNSKGLMLRLITAFTAIFALGLILFSSSSSRRDVFIATIGFSAVMVVFVQSQLTPP